MLWPAKHWKTLQQAYSKAPGFRTYGPAVEDLYRQLTSDALLDINLQFIRLVCELLDIRTPIVLASEYVESCDRVERLVSICQQLGATEYVSGPSAQSYIDSGPFEEVGIQLTWMDYSGYPVYPQLHGEFVHAVSILDLLFSMGEEARAYLSKPGPVAERDKSLRKIEIN
jgi:hypothetical protein